MGILLPNSTNYVHPHEAKKTVWFDRAKTKVGDKPGFADQPPEFATR